MIETDEKDGVVWLTMRHGKANALDLEFCQEIVAAFEAQRATTARALVLTGQGRMFSAGVDLPRLADGGIEYVRQFLPVLHRLYDTVFHFPKPVVAAVNGHAIAGGCVLACCADHRVMAEGPGRAGITELAVGVPFPALAFEVMRSVVPRHHFLEVVLGASTYDPSAAQDRGLVDAVVAASDLDAKAAAAAQKLAALPPVAFALTKRQFRQETTDRMARDGAAVDAAVTAVWTQPDTIARVRDYIARTLRKG